MCSLPSGATILGNSASTSLADTTEKNEQLSFEDAVLEPDESSGVRGISSSGEIDAMDESLGHFQDLFIISLIRGVGSELTQGEM
jgi:hypothetical protein